MNPALVFLFVALLKQRTRRLFQALRRPAPLLGTLSAAVTLGWIYHLYRRESALGELLQPVALTGYALVMLAGSVLKGFLQRGLAFDLPDVEFLFPGPFAQRHLIFYRLAPNYLYAVVAGLVFGVLFNAQLDHPILAVASLIAFQIICFHVAAGMAIFGGSLSEPAFYTTRWLLLGLVALSIALYARTALLIHLLPGFLSAEATPWLFYPAVNLSRLGGASGLRDTIWAWTQSNLETGAVGAQTGWRVALCFAALAVAALGSFAWLGRLRMDVLEASLKPSERIAESRRQAQQGRYRLAKLESAWSLLGAAAEWPIFHGAGAVVWKNLTVAWRSRRELALALAFTLLLTLPWFLALPGDDNGDLRRFVIPLAIGFLPALLQQSLPFDFRIDGLQLPSLRGLPARPLTIVMAAIAAPTLFCLALQLLSLGLLAGGSGLFLSWMPDLFREAGPENTRFPVSTLAWAAFGFPVMTVGVTATWNLHYLVSAAQRAASPGAPKSGGAFGTLTIVLFTVAVFAPAVWLFERLPHWGWKPIAAPVALVTQLAVDYALLCLLARRFERCESDART